MTILQDNHQDACSTKQQPNCQHSTTWWCQQRVILFIDNVHAWNNSALMNFTFFLLRKYIFKKIHVQQERGNIYVQCTEAINLQQNMIPDLTPTPYLLLLSTVCFVNISFLVFPYLSCVQKSVSQPFLSIFSAVNSMRMGLCLPLTVPLPIYPQC